jgi:20S proteasome subunit beta 1
MTGFSELSGLETARGGGAMPGVEPYQGEHMTGTTIMAVQYKDGVVVGADSRTTTGAYIANRVTDKLTKLTDNIYCCRSGSAADTQAVADIVAVYLRMHSMEVDDVPTVQMAANLARKICYENKDRLLAGLIIAGYDKVHKGSVYTISLGGATVKQPFSIGGSGSSYIYGFCDANWKPDMTEEEAKSFVAKAISLAMARDGSSGGVVRLATINETGVHRDFIPGNKLPYLAENYNF